MCTFARVVAGLRANFRDFFGFNANFLWGQTSLASMQTSLASKHMRAVRGCDGYVLPERLSPRIYYSIT